MACPGGARPKPNAPAIVVAGGAALVAILCSRAPPLCPYVSALSALASEPATDCTPDPPPLPTWTAADVVGIATGQSTVKLYQTIRHYLWWEYCECVSGATPPPTLFVPPQPMPVLAPALEQPCDVREASFTITLQTHDLIPVPGFGQVLDFWDALPSGVTHVQQTATILDLEPGHAAVGRTLTLHHGNPTLGTAGLPPLVLTEASPSATRLDALPSSSTMFLVRYTTQLGGGTLPVGEVISYKAEFFCGEPGGAQPACCPPDMTLVALLEDLALKVNLLVERAGPSEPLEQLISTEIAGEGQLNLELGTRAIVVRTTTAGPSVELVPYATPDRAMRLGTVRFGNDFGWRRREHVDSLACEFSVPADMDVVSWSLSAGTSAELVQLGAPR